MQSPNNERYGCLTGIGIIAAIIAFISIVGVAFSSGSQMFTAGALSASEKSGTTYNGVKSHAEIKDCAACHASPWGADTMADRCLACHENISAQLTDAMTLHGATANNGEKSSCRECHPDHRGADASLTTVNHSLFGFPLEGKHARTKCQDCHQKDAFKDTPKDCYSCHKNEDEHNGKFGTNCAACHNPNDWDSVQKVNHDMLDKNAGTSCESCHKDPAFHRGAFDGACADCHSTTSWSPARYDLSHPRISHEGGTGVNHGHTSCSSCHPSTVFEATCGECHGGFFGEGGEGGDGEGEGGFFGEDD